VSTDPPYDILLLNINLTSRN